MPIISAAPAVKKKKETKQTKGKKKVKVIQPDSRLIVTGAAWGQSIQFASKIPIPNTDPVDYRLENVLISGENTAKDLQSIGVDVQQWLDEGKLIWYDDYDPNALPDID